MEATQEAPARPDAPDQAVPARAGRSPEEMEALILALEAHVRDLHEQLRGGPSGLAELYTALAAAQAEIVAAEQNRENPHLKSRYATLNAVWDACRAPLTKNGLCLTQFPSFDGGRVRVRTVLGHKSGQEIESTLELPPGKQDIQGIGSAITYARRYVMSALVGVCPDDDDDGTHAMREEKQGQGGRTPRVPESPPQSGRARQANQAPQGEQPAAPARTQKKADEKADAPTNTTGALPVSDKKEAAGEFWAAVMAVDGVPDVKKVGELDKAATREAVIARLHKLGTAGQLAVECFGLENTSESLADWVNRNTAEDLRATVEAYRAHARAEREAEDEIEAAVENAAGARTTPAEEAVAGMFDGLPQ